MYKYVKYFPSVIYYNAMYTIICESIDRVKVQLITKGLAFKFRDVNFKFHISTYKKL